MAKLGIKGHETRGEEVIKLLEMLGGTNKFEDISFITPYIFLYVDDDYYTEIGWEFIGYDDNYEGFVIYTLEEFEEKFPYKVGDEVEHKSIGDANLKSKIIYMEWCNALNKVLYTTEDAQVISTEDVIETKTIPPYMDYDIKTNKEEDKDIIEHATEINLNHPCFDGHNKIELIIPENWKFEQIGNKMFGIRKYPQYPKTYDECCEILGISRYDVDIDLPQPYQEKMFNFFKLLICRNAYWKIAGEQMGLDQSWEPDWGDDLLKYYISFYSNEVDRCVIQYSNKILVFPTEKMRDEFYDNFKDLIEQCAELL